MRCPPVAVPAESERMVAAAVERRGAGRHRHEESGADEGECEVPTSTGAVPAVGADQEDDR